MVSVFGRLFFGNLTYFVARFRSSTLIATAVMQALAATAQIYL